jgi:chemotaxis protein MotB
MAGAKGGGQWKVAYADFVTAMMALFLVLWITSQDQKIKEAVAHSFNAPFESLMKDPPNTVPRAMLGVMPSTQTKSTPYSQQGKYDSPSVVDMETINQLNESLLKALQTNPELEKGNSVKLELTGEGLNISVFDRTRKPIFKPGTPQFTEYGSWVFSTLAWEISRYKNFYLDLEGHTGQGGTPVRENYDQWELSSDRANAARRILVAHGVSAEQVRKISGYGDTMPMPNSKPDDEINNRVTVLLGVNRANQLQASLRHE